MLVFARGKEGYGGTAFVSHSTPVCAWGGVRCYHDFSESLHICVRMGVGSGGDVITTFVSHSLGESFCACVCSGKGGVRWHNLHESFGMSTLRGEGTFRTSLSAPVLAWGGGGGGGALLL